MKSIKRTLRVLNDFQKVINEDGDVALPEGYLAKTLQACVLAKKRKDV